MRLFIINKRIKYIFFEPIMCYTTENQIWQLYLIEYYISEIPHFILWRKTNVYGALSSIVIGTLSWVLLIFLFFPYTDGEVWDAIYIASVPAFVIGCATIILISLNTQRICPPKPIQDIDGRDISDTELFQW